MWGMDGSRVPREGRGRGFEAGRVGSERGRGSGIGGVRRGPGTAPPSGAAGLIEVELGYGVGRVERGRLVEVIRRDGVLCRYRADGIGVEVEGSLGRIPCGRESWRGVRELEVAEDGARGPGVGEEGEDAHGGAALGAAEGEDLADAGEEMGPAGAGGAAGEGGERSLVSVRLRLLAVGFGDLDAPLPSEGDDVAPEPCVRGEDAWRNGELVNRLRRNG
jgi:hypothetical protein